MEKINSDVLNLDSFIKIPRNKIHFRTKQIKLNNIKTFVASLENPYFGVSTKSFYDFIDVLESAYVESTKLSFKNFSFNFLLKKMKFYFSLIEKYYALSYNHYLFNSSLRKILIDCNLNYPTPISNQYRDDEYSLNISLFRIDKLFTTTGYDLDIILHVAKPTNATVISYVKAIHTDEVKSYTEESFCIKESSLDNFIQGCIWEIDSYKNVKFTEDKFTNIYKDAYLLLCRLAKEGYFVKDIEECFMDINTNQLIEY